MISKVGLFLEARFCILYCLYWTTKGVSVRELAYRTGKSLHTIQNGLVSLKKLGLVKSKTRGQRLVCFLNKTHREYHAVSRLVATLSEDGISQQAKLDAKANRNTLAMLNQMQYFGASLKNAKH